MPENTSDYGIKYKVVRQKEGLYFLFPIALVEGCAAKNTFYGNHEYRILNSLKDLKKVTVVDSIMSTEALKKMYDCDDIDFLKEYYENDELDKIEIITVQEGKIRRVKIEAKIFEETNILETYQVEQGKPFVILNKETLEDVLSAETAEEMRARLLHFKELLSKIKVREKEGTTKVTVKNGSVVGIESNRKILPVSDNNPSNETPKSIVRPEDISVTGLEKYIKERVFGHDKEIRALAKSIIMNFTAIKGEKSEPILLIGPTGTGKTETMRAVGSYLNIPIVEINAANLVPQGIKGMSLEDCLYSLITSCNYKLEEAERGIVFLDEFDKLGRISADYKTPVIQILLKFIEGGTFFIDKPTDDYTFDTTLLIKVIAGAFTDLFLEEKAIGFNSASKEKEFKAQNITEKDYFGKELITRIPHILVFKELSREEKKRVILCSKISEYLIKKERYARQFHVELQATDSYIEAILDRLTREQRSMRELNNIIIESLDEAEYEMLSHPGKYRELILTREIVEDNQNFNLK